MDLKILCAQILEIAVPLPLEEFSPTEFFISGRVFLIDQIRYRSHHHIVRREKQEWDREPFPLVIYHHPMFYTLISVIAPNLHNTKSQKKDLF